MGQAIRNFFTNYWVVSAIGAWFLAQFIKIFTGVFRQRKFSIHAMLFGTGGMPSSHTASVCALCTAFAVSDGFSSRGFAISALLCVVVITDAVGVRRETIVNLERGKYNPSLKLAMDIAKVFHVTVEELFSYDD